uniref:von Willebrand factor n=1 Tax=Esox lucius TaxID=8010 RepID=A0A3P8XEF0_ESOLU
MDGTMYHEILANNLLLSVRALKMGLFAVGLSDRCSLFGRHHVHTFDGILYQFPGDCSYLLAGDCDQRAFTLLGDFVRGQRSGVTLFLGEVFELHLSVNGHLSQGQKRLSLPYAFQGVFVGSELGFYKMWSEEFGFSVTIDNQANVALTMAKHHSNHTCGLCGNFNGEPDDDYTAQEGFLTEDSYDFANSWALKGAGEPCRRVSPPSQSCNTTADTPTVLSRCSVLQNSPVFLRCANVVSPETFLSICEEEACHCGQGEGLGAGPDCHCNVLLEFARTCLAHGQLLNGWLEDSQCSPRCPVGMQYKECARSCSTTCQSLNIQEVCNEECVDGCTCPVGKVIDGDRCVEVSQCSCVHMGRHFPPGSSISQDCNTCICRHGSWECTNQGCPGECMVTGQSHFKTFDNKFFTFSGHCQYLLAKDCTDNAFSVIIETVQCADETDAVCTRSVTLSLKSLEAMTVKLKHGGVVSVNDLDIRTPMNHGRLRIQRMVQSGVRVLYGNDLHLEWDGRGHVLLKLWPVWAGNTCGLCGNYNGNQGDDFLSAAGLVEAGPQAFGQSWRINGDCNSAPRPDTDPCSLNPKREEACGMMMSEVFRPCHFLVNPLPFLRFCRYDVCVCSNGEECLCSALASYAAACSARGVLLTWRTPEHCAMKCPVGQVYETCGSVCQRSCRTLSGKEPGCTEQTGCEEGCFCPPGQYLSDTGECVSPEFCPCLHDGQLYQPNDVYADHNSICYCENGSMKCSSNEMSETMLSDMFYEDEQPFSRGKRRSAPCAPPLRHVGCEGGGQGLECSRTCQNLDLPCLSLACRPGCLCPNGTVRHRRECIVPEQCPCYHNKRAYAPGQRITVDCNTCVCENRHWHCTKQVCDGVCRTVGEGHYITFDGLQYSFPGLCQYVLVQDQCGGEEGSFRVLVENEACGVVGHRCAKAVTVFYKGGIITMEHGQVSLRHTHGSEVEIVRSGQFFILLLGKHISISWDLGTRLLERVCGLCGNYDGNLNNDLLSSNNQLEVDSAHFGNSWKVKPSCADATQPSPPCSNNIVKLVMVEQSCRVLSGTLFRDCNSLVDPEPYVEMCVEAACSCPTVGDCVCFCDVIAAYAQACSERGMAVSWRTNDLCPLSCEDLNIAAEVLGGEPCQWRYNTCSSACPITCQHPEPLPCPFTCLEGCHATCPPGQLLDEVSMRCVEPTQCHVCYHDGERISHGNKVILNHDDPKHCQICHCENNTLSCKVCPVLEITVSTTLPADLTTPTALPFSTLMPEHSCDRAMDLAFLLDGSAALSEEDFLSVKEFILSVVDRFRMGSAHTRATVLLYHSGVKTYDLQWLFKKTVRELHYSGGDVAFLDEAVKYLAIHIYDKNKREHAGRVAIILTANINPRPLRRTVKLLRTKDITTLTLALGPEASWSQVNEITKARPDNRAYQLNSVAELPINFLEVTDYLCTLGLEPETPKPHPTKPSSPANLALTTTTSPAPSKEITFILEGSDSVGEVGFNKSLHFLEEVISQLAEEDEQSVRVTVIQYSVTITVEITRWEIQWHRTQLLQRLREIRWRGGAKTNTGAAISQTFQEIITDRTSSTTPPLVFLVTENPPTDVITRPLSHTHSNVFPIGVGRKVTEVDLLPLSSPQRPLMILTEKTVLLFHNLPCRKPMDILFLLGGKASVGPDTDRQTEGETAFEDMKTFVKAFINSADIGMTTRHLQHSSHHPITTQLSPPNHNGLGLRFLHNCNVSDDITLLLGVSVFPIGIGHGYNRAELHMLGSHGNQDNTLHLNSLEELMMLLTLDKSYVDRLCRGTTTHTTPTTGVNCDRLEPPVCISYMSPVRVEETCGCRWDCPCVCMGSSTNHVVRFDSLALKLDGEGICSYTLLTVAGGKMVIGGSEVTLHMGTCQGSANHNDICMKAMEVTHGLSSVLLKDDMTVTVNGAPVSMPYHSRQVEVMRFGEVMFQLKSVEHGYILAFTPQNNEFTLTLSSSSTNHTAGLCGLCGEETVKRLSLRNGSLTLDPALLLSDWSVPGGEGVCVPRRSPVCVYGASRACEVLRSEVFSSCHTHVPIMPFITRCQKEACQETDVCDVISSYTHLCRQRGLCVHWRSSHLCPMQCPSIMEYDACRMGCVEDCSSINLLPGDTGVFRGNKSACMTTPTEGCFCPQGTVLLGGECVSPDVCNQCVDQHGHRHQYLHTWVPEDNHCQICMCLDYQRINCTAKPCLDAKAPVCGPCEVLREKRESKCCPEYECVCDMVSCELPEIPRCEDGLTVVLTNPGECQPIHQCACKKEECSLQAPPACPSHRRLSVKQTQCCDSFQCVCDCHNSTHSCPPGFISSFSTNDCGCTETACMPDQVCVVGGVVYHVGSQWEEGCEKCSCTQQRDSHTNLHIAQCVPPVCDHTCPLVTTPTHTHTNLSRGNCTHTHTHTHTYQPAQCPLGEVWRSPEDMCVLHQCVSVGDGEVFITHTNVSCPPLDPPPCPLGTELHCDTSACCPQCHCGIYPHTHTNPHTHTHKPTHTHKRLMVDMCTHCSCSVEDGAVKRYKLSCRRISSCLYTLQVNTTLTEGCSQFSCGVNSKGELVLKTILTTCPPFERQLCLDHGGKVSQIGTSCCEMCKYHVFVQNLCLCERCVYGKCHSKSMYSLETNSMKKECVCCTAMKTEPLSVPLLCPNGTLTHHNVMSVTACDCQDLHCT